jgi:hypothetical protein
MIARRAATSSNGRYGTSAANGESPVYFYSTLGKGTHGRLYFGGRFTTLKDRKKEIGPGLLKAVLDQLGLRRDDIEV